MATAKKPKLTATLATTPRRKPATTAAAKKPGTAAAPKTKAAAKTTPAPEVMPGEIERLAYQLWEERGRPEGNSLEDWNRAQKILLQSR